MEPKRFRKQWLWALLNLAGMILFVKVGSALWVPPGEEGMPGGLGDAFHFLLNAFPILVTFLLLDLAALAWTLVRTPRANRRTVMALWFAVAALWCGVVAFDHHRSVREIDARYSGLVDTASGSRRADSTAPGPSSPDRSSRRPQSC